MKESLESARTECNCEQSMSDVQGNLRSRGIDVVPSRNLCKIVKIHLQNAIEDLNDCVIDLKKLTVIDALETYNTDHNEAFIRGAI